MEKTKILKGKFIWINLLFLICSCNTYKNTDIFDGVCITADELKFENVQLDIDRQAKKKIKSLVKNKFDKYKVEYIFYNTKDNNYYVRLSNFSGHYCLKINTDYKIIEENYYLFET